jgi:hypothetical protein
MPQKFQQFLNDNFAYLFVGAFLWSSFCIAFMLWRRKIRGPHFPDFTTENVLFEERRTSGCSHKSLFTRMGGASNCLRVAVTDKDLWITPHFPFSAFAAPLDLDHRIRRDSITKVERKGRTVRITFIQDDGEERMIELRLRNADQFLAVLQPSVADGDDASRQNRVG